MSSSSFVMRRSGPLPWRTCCAASSSPRTCRVARSRPLHKRQHCGQSNCPIARASGATFAVRVTVVQRQDTKDRLHQEDWDSRDASGFAGRRETVDVGPTTNTDDLRLDVIASLRRSADDYLVNRWIDSGGALDVDGIANDSSRRWEAIYDAMAERLSRQVIAALPWTRAR